MIAHNAECQRYRSVYAERYRAHLGRRQPARKVCICHRDEQ